VCLQNTSTGIFGMQLLNPAEFVVGIFFQIVGALMFTFVATVGLSAVTKVRRPDSYVVVLCGKSREHINKSTVGKSEFLESSPPFDLPLHSEISYSTIKYHLFG